MLTKVAYIFKMIYGWTAFVTLLNGFIVAVLFGISFIIGGSAGETLAVFSGDLMTFSIRLATLAMISGIVYMYIEKDHRLTLSTEENQSESQ